MKNFTKEAEKLLKKKKINKLPYSNHNNYESDYDDGYNQAIDDCIPIVANLLKQIDELEAGSIEKVGVKDIEKNIKIMSDEKIEKAPNPEYAGAYNQGKFDVLMEIKRLNKLKEKE